MNLFNLQLSVMPFPIYVSTNLLNISQRKKTLVKDTIFRKSLVTLEFPAQFLALLHVAQWLERWYARLVA